MTQGSIRSMAKTREGIRAAVKGKAETIRDNEWREKYSRLFANKPADADVHADVIALNRSWIEPGETENKAWKARMSWRARRQSTSRIAYIRGVCGSTSYSASLLSSSL